MMPLWQQIITIAACVAGTQITRHLPFLVFSGKSDTPAFVKYLGKALPAAVFAMLVIYCIKDVDFSEGMHGAPELIAIAATSGLHIWRRNMLLSIAVGTICYMILIHIM